jgi:hypothetical protein
MNLIADDQHRRPEVATALGNHSGGGELVPRIGYAFLVLHSSLQLASTKNEDRRTKNQE